MSTQIFTLWVVTPSTNEPAMTSGGVYGAPRAKPRIPAVTRDHTISAGFPIRLVTGGVIRAARK